MLKEIESSNKDIRVIDRLIKELPQIISNLLGLFEEEIQLLSSESKKINYCHIEEDIDSTIEQKRDELRKIEIEIRDSKDFHLQIEEKINSLCDRLCENFAINLKLTPDSNTPRDAL